MSEECVRIDEVFLGEVDAALKAQNDFNRTLQRRRFIANQLRVKANQIDAETNLAWEEMSEIQPTPFDYEPVQPIPAPKAVKKGP